MNAPSVNDSLMALFSSFPAPDSGDAQSAVLAYRMAIEGIGPEFVAGAVRRFIRGEVKRERHAFLPTAPELAIEARRVRDEAAATRYAPLPKPVEKPTSPEDRAKVAALLAELADKIEPRRQAYRMSPEEELALLSQEPIRVSAALISKINPSEAA